MISNLLISRQLMLLCFCLMTTISITACAGLFNFGGETWKEEVLLSDERIIVVERETIRAAGGDEFVFNRSGTKPKEYRIRFSTSKGTEKTVEWKSTKISPATWPEVPLVFDIVSGAPIVITLVYISNGCQLHTEYRYKDDHWIEFPLPDQFQRRMSNLLIFNDLQMDGFVNLEEKRKKNSESHTQGFRQIGPTRKICG